MRVPGGHGTAIADNVVFPANLLPRGRWVRVPEISLVAAIFRDAVHCVRRTTHGVTERQFLDASEWIASERRDRPFAFVNVCDVLGVDPTVARTRLRIWHERAGNGSRA